MAFSNFLSYKCRHAKDAFFLEISLNSKSAKCTCLTMFSQSFQAVKSIEMKKKDNEYVLKIKCYILTKSK